MDEMEELTRAYEHEKFAQAKERMEDITAFYIHLALHYRPNTCGGFMGTFTNKPHPK